MKISRAAAILLLSTAAALAAPSHAPGQAAFLEALAGPGEEVKLNYGKLPDGTGGKLKTSTTEDGAMALEIVGRVKLNSPRLTLRSNYLNYNPKAEELEAHGEVFVQQPEATVEAGKLIFDFATGVMTLTENVTVGQEAFTASSQKLVYDREADSFVLTGNPVVDQHTPENKGRFAGMEELRIVREATGAAKVRMNGGKEIICEVLPAEPKEGEAAAPQGAGFAGLGEQVKIVTRPLGKEDPSVSLSTSAAGAMGEFYARGSVLLESDQLNLRADQLQYDAEAGRVEALRNVVIRQDQVEAECGQMIYDIAKNRIELSIDPVVRQKKEEGTLIISQVASIVITPGEDGGPTIETFPLPDQESETRFIPNEPETEEKPSEPATNEPEEIDLQDDEDIERIGN